MENKNLLDTIETDEKTMTGIVDYTNKKHVIFYDFTNNDQPEYVLLVISWKLSNNNTRFSVFKNIYFPHLKIDAIVINKKTIKYSSVELSPSEQNKTKKRISTK